MVLHEKVKSAMWPMFFLSLVKCGAVFGAEAVNVEQAQGSNQAQHAKSFVAYSHIDAEILYETLAIYYDSNTEKQTIDTARDKKQADLDRAIALGAMGRIKSERGVEAILSVISDKTDHPAVRGVAVLSLAQPQFAGNNNVWQGAVSAPTCLDFSIPVAPIEDESILRLLLELLWEEPPTWQAKEEEFRALFEEMKKKNPRFERLRYEDIAAQAEMQERLSSRQEGALFCLKSAVLTLLGCSQQDRIALEAIQHFYDQANITTYKVLAIRYVRYHPTDAGRAFLRRVLNENNNVECIIEAVYSLGMDRETWGDKELFVQFLSNPNIHEEIRIACANVLLAPYKKYEPGKSQVIKENEKSAAVQVGPGKSTYELVDMYLVERIISAANEAKSLVERGAYVRLLGRVRPKQRVIADFLHTVAEHDEDKKLRELAEKTLSDY